MTTAFAASKAAQRSLAESMKGKPDDFFVKPVAVADAAYYLSRQEPLIVVG